jgi:hypothetical protein
MIWAIVIIAVLIGGVLSGIFMIAASFTGGVNLPEKDRWYSGIYRPSKGSEGVIAFVGIVWTIVFAIALIKFSGIVIETHW